jgi:hypothetical protein
MTTGVKKALGHWTVRVTQLNLNPCIKNQVSSD